MVSLLARVVASSRKVQKRLPGKENSNSHGARTVHQIISMIKWIRTSRFSMKIRPLLVEVVVGDGDASARPMPTGYVP